MEVLIIVKTLILHELEAKNIKKIVTNLHLNKYQLQGKLKKYCILQVKLKKLNLKCCFIKTYLSSSLPLGCPCPAKDDSTKLYITLMKKIKSKSLLKLVLVQAAAHRVP